jgi:1,4-alpha-glucan branching enzyme
MRTSTLAGGIWLAAAVGCSAASHPRVDAGLVDGGSNAGTDAGFTGDAGPMGATLVPGGAEFRVWAPNATAATVVGDFGSQAMAAVGDATFVAFVAGAAAGQAYHYELQSGGQTLERTDPRVRLTGTDPGRQEPTGYLFDPTTYAWQSAPFVAPPQKQMVIYELHVGTFVDPTGTGAGTYASAATKLADLAQLGINMVELMPVTEFPGGYSWGYAPLYALAPSQLYGTPDDLKAFIDQAHQAGIGVILDVVFNHFQLDSQTTPSLSMWCFDGPCSGGGIYFSPEPSTPWGPRPAFGVGPVAALIKDAIADWQKDYRVDGFRWDSVIAIRNTSLDGTGTEIDEGAELLKNVNVAIHALNPGALSVAEDLQGWSEITSPVDPTTLDEYDSGYGFDTQWDDGFDFTVKPLLTAASDADRDVTQLAGEPLTYGPPMQRVVFTEDHDQVAPQNGADDQRIPALIGMSDNGYYAEKRSSLGIAIVMTTPAIPMLFMGQEFLTTLPFPFSPALAIDWTDETTYAGFRQMVHDLIALRENVTGTTLGLTGNNIDVLTAENDHNGTLSPAIAYRRWDQGGPGDDVIVATSFCNGQLALPVGLPASGAWHVRFNSDDQSYDANFGGTPSTDVVADGGALDGQAQSGTVNLGPYSVVILSQ